MAQSPERSHQNSLHTVGEPTAAVIGDNYAIVDRKLYQTKCRSEDEAYYLLTVINSDELEMAAATFMTKGLYGARDFEKHGWKLPIPLYEARNLLHARLSELGKAAEQECTDLIANSDILTKPAGDSQSRAARSLLRHEWQPNSTTAQAIEAAVAQLLSDPAQAALAEQQIKER